MSESTPARLRSSPGNHGPAVVLLIVGFFFLPLLYCFMLGPAVWWADTQGGDASLVLLVFAPLKWLRDNVDVAGRVLDWYVDLWR